MYGYSRQGCVFQDLDDMDTMLFGNKKTNNNNNKGMFTHTVIILDFVVLIYIHFIAQTCFHNFNIFCMNV